MHLADNIALREGLLGGLLLGASASGFMYLTGRISGISGIVEGTVVKKGENWHYSYLLGLLSSGYLFSQISPEVFGPATDLSLHTLIAGGMISGFGTRLSGGCTSGHGLCGLGRLSPRSLTSVLLFMSTGMITSHFARAERFRSLLVDSTLSPQPDLSLFVPTAVILVISTLRKWKLKHQSSSSLQMHLSAFASAFLFGCGLCYSGMVNHVRIERFLDIFGTEGFDPTLAGVLGGGLCVTSFFFPLMQKKNTKTVVEGKHLGKTLKVGTCPENLVIDWKLVVGSILFGMGWGLIGLCPGPAVVAIAAPTRAAMAYIPSFLIGVLVKEALVK